MPAPPPGRGLDDGQPPAPLEPATPEDVATAGAAHPGTEAVLTLAGDSLRLISALRHGVFPYSNYRPIVGVALGGVNCDQMRTLVR